ncbi:MAG: thioredoxin family protein [Gammaproteobacteria bacterium]
MAVDVELFFSPYCRQCSGARRALRAALETLPPGIANYHEKNVMEELERAVALGIIATPALVVAGKLLPVSRWQRQPLQQALLQSFYSEEHVR